MRPQSGEAAARGFSRFDFKRSLQIVRRIQDYKTMKHLLLKGAGGLFSLVGCAAVVAATAPQPIAVPPGDAVFTSTREVTNLMLDNDGALWVGTSGGVLRRDAKGAWRKWTRRDGLPSHEIRAIKLKNEIVTVTTPRGTVSWRNNRWNADNQSSIEESANATSADNASTSATNSGAKSDAASDTKKVDSTSAGDATQGVRNADESENEKAAVSDAAAIKKAVAADVVSADAIAPVISWRGQRVVATLEGLRLGSGKASRVIGLPPSSGTHISALGVHGTVLRAAMFGDGLWEYDGKKWRALNVGLPLAAREITAMIEDEKKHVLWIGTRREGVWRGDERAKTWTQHRQSDEPFNHNVQALIGFRGEMLMSTLEDGLVARGAKGWRHLVVAPHEYSSAGASRAKGQSSRDADAVLSSVAPRQMIAWHGALYVRHGGGSVDRNDGKTWTRDVFASLPRSKVFAIAADDKAIYAAQWGGWSEWNGVAWRHFLDVAGLKGLPIMGLCPDGDTLWIATQSRGIAQYSHRDGTLRWHDERMGLPDDWITGLQKIGDSLYAGTFVGGLARFDGKTWTTAPELKGENVTALEPDNRGGLYIATRNGIWHRSQAGQMTRLVDRTPFLDSEAQTLCLVPGGLWIGTRTGLYFLCDASLQDAAPSA